MHFPVEFRTPFSSRVADGFAAFALGFGIAFVAFLFPVALSLLLVDEMEISPYIVAALVIPVVLGGWVYAWSVFAYRMRASVAFHPKHIQLGDGFMAVQSPYSEIEEVQFPEEDQGNWLLLRIGGRPVRVVLRGKALREAHQLLMNLCDNAVFVDASGKEYISVNANLDFTLLTLERRQRRIAIGSALASSCFGLLFVGRAWVAMQWLNEELDIDGIDLILLWASLILMLLATICCVFAAVRSLRQAIELGKKRILLAPAKSPGDFQSTGSD